MEKIDGPVVGLEKFDEPALDVLAVLIGWDDGMDRLALIVRQLRLPRALLTALVGALLAICGAAMQGLFRNPLADPSLIGVTAGASAPEVLIDEVIDAFRGRYDVTVTPVETATENVEFKVPRILREPA